MGIGDEGVPLVLTTDDRRPTITQRLLPREWFALQLGFAERAGAIAGLDLPTALLRFSGCYLQFGGGWDFDPVAPVWEEPIWVGYATRLDPLEWTVAFYQRQHWQPAATRRYGCFSYTFVPETRKVRLHFSNDDTSGQGALSAARQEMRCAELRALFAEVAAAHPDALTVRGNSWLHGIAAYRRLYPPEYGATAIPAPLEEEFQYMALWGQFLASDGQIKRDLADDFLRCCQRATTINALAACFPNKVYEVECAIRHFYDFYGLPVLPETGHDL